MLLTRCGALDALSMTALTALTAYGRGADAADPNASSDLAGEIRGAGATSQSDTQNAWMNIFMDVSLRATVDYASGGSEVGRTRLVENAVDFAGTDTPIAAGKISRIGGAVELSLYISPITVAYNLPGFAGKSHVSITGEVLAKVLSGAVARWNNLALTTLNPGATLSDLRIIIVGHSDDSGTTKALTTYLATVAPKTWPHKPEETQPPHDGQSGDGTAGMIWTISAATGTIGYAGASKVPATLGTVAVGSNGVYMPVSVKAAAATLNAATLGSEADGTRLLYQPSRDAKGVYPIVLVSYLAARLRYDDTRIAAVVKVHLRFAVSIRKQDASTKATDYAPAAQQMRRKINAAIDKIAV